MAASLIRCGAVTEIWAPEPNLTMIAVFRRKMGREMTSLFKPTCKPVQFAGH